MFRFHRLRSILCLSNPENAKCESYYSEISCATAQITYLERQHTGFILRNIYSYKKFNLVVLPVGLMLLLQEIYDEHPDLDHETRVTI